MSVDIKRLPILRPGDRGQAVKAAKMGINVWNAKRGNTTPFYGPFLIPLVKQFKVDQRVGDLGTTAAIGPKTWAALLKYIPLEGQKLLPQLTPWVPTLLKVGPVMAGGKSLLDHQLTHATSGIPLFPAFDTAFYPNRLILAPEDLIVDTRLTSSMPGSAIYTTGKSGLRYWFGHLDRSHPLGTKFLKGQPLGKTIITEVGGGPHVHVGVNCEKLMGTSRQFLYGKNGDGPPYTYGAPSIRTQLLAFHSL